MACPIMIGIDWGTSSFRASLVDKDGEVLDNHESPHGILAVPGNDFEGFLRNTIGPWLESFPSVPIIVSGMITSRNGWIETPYLPVPLGIDDLADALVQHYVPGLGTIHFITGAAQAPEGERPDVIRGEETELFGYLSTHNLSEGTFLLPGTHNKWLRAEQRKITHFATCMTGELFALLRKHSILASTMEDTAFKPHAFQRGLEAARRQPGALLETLFSTRSLALFQHINTDETADYLSGLLIGEEFLSQLRHHEKPSFLNIIGRQDLALRYQLAARFFGIPSAIATPGLSLRGQLAVAHSARLIS